MQWNHALSGQQQSMKLLLPVGYWIPDVQKQNSVFAAGVQTAGRGCKNLADRAICLVQHKVCRQ